MAFVRLEKRLHVHSKLSGIKRQREKPVINYDNSVNIFSSIEVNPHVSQRELANTSGIT